MFKNLFEIENTPKHGIETLEVMVRFLSVLEAKASKGKSEINRFKSFLIKKLKRGLTQQEEIHLLEGIVKYLQSDAATDERAEAMIYLFNLNFLTKNNS